MRRHSFPIHHGAAHKQRGRTGLHHKDIDLSLMPFDLAVGLSETQQKQLVGKIGELFYRQVMWISCCLLIQGLTKLLQRRSAPVFETCRC